MKPAALLLALILSACASGSTVTTDTTPPTATAGADTTATTAGDVDPYETFLALAPPDAPAITRDDAQLRAMLGCGNTFAPGTTDAALQEAYAALIEGWRQQGMCGG